MHMLDLPMRSRSRPVATVRRVVAHYFFGAYILLLALCLPFVRRAWIPARGSHAYAVALDLTQAALYLAPAFLLTQLVLAIARADRARVEKQRWRAAIVYTVAFALTTATAVAIVADGRVFEIFGFHLDGFVWNLVTTPGGIDSMGLGSEGEWSAVRVIGTLAGAHAALLWGARHLARSEARLAAPWRVYRFALPMIVLVALGERVTYAVGQARANASILMQANAFPVYLPITARTFLTRLGIATRRSDDLPTLDNDSSQLAYPLVPIRVEPPERPWNLVWLVGESLRWDALDPEVMPAAWGLARDGWRFTQHYSGGNGTRMGMFSMFYGLYGSYWFPFLDERRSPVLIDVLQQQDYQIGLFTSARFSYPEFDRTIFAHVPASAMHTSEASYHEQDWERGWTNDRDRVSDLLAFLAQRNRRRPFFAFMFFESTHFRYYFPESSAIRRPYAQDLDLDELASERNVGLARARYVNAAHHLDQQLARILDALRDEGELDHTIVLLTGDHGEEFYEKGRRGHNSEFHEEQIRVPLVIRIPGNGAHEVARMTSHVDLPATILPLLGVRNPAEDYSLGHDLRGGDEREFTVVADWSRLGIVGPHVKLAVPLGPTGLFRADTWTTRDDRALEDTGAVQQVAEDQLRRAIADLHRFRRAPQAYQATARLSADPARP
jgi:membrane-anchored protein YejM (alkaline phosphatase superfamily)